MTYFERSAGVLAHVSSLPGECGIGDLGDCAYRFVDFLNQSGQRIWQLLPLGPTTRGESPYSCYSAFAGNPLLISPQKLVDRGLLPAAATVGLPRSKSNSNSVDFDSVRAVKTQLLHASFEHFLQTPNCQAFDEFESFCTQHRWWLDDFSLFSALMNFFGTDDWCQWEGGLVRRQANCLTEWREKLARQIEYEQYVQYVFFTQWQELKRYANQRGVKLFGDMPIFVAHGSADVWSHQRLFWLNDQGKPLVVAGVPPDYFSATGQLWGNPLYNWDALRASNYHWWTARFHSAFELYDLLRIDHFRAFEAYWEIPAGSLTAIAGTWAKGPGSAPFRAAQAALGELAIIAEDLGMITDKVHQLRDELGFPGMRVLQFGFDDEHDNFHRPESYPENSVAYTGTHDNSTIVGWYQARKATEQPDILDRYLQDPVESGMPIHWQLISMVLRSPSHTAIVPLQDILGLDDSARMNVPGLADGNWRWRFSAEDLTPDISERLRIISVASDR